MTLEPNSGSRLDRAALGLNAAVKAAQRAEQHSRQGEAAKAEAAAREAAEEGHQAMMRLLALGARLTELSPFPEGGAIPLTLLDTPDSRLLLFTLEKALEIAERVDETRGRTLPSQVPFSPGLPRGTDLTQALIEIVLRLRTEIHGPRGLD